jgi:hypothetical protein
MAEPKEEDERPAEEAERIAREAIRRSFNMPHKPQKELIGKTPRAKARKRLPLTSSPKSP